MSHPPAPPRPIQQPKKPATRHRSPRSVVRHFFDELEYITYRIFLYVLMAIGMYAVISHHFR